MLSKVPINELQVRMASFRMKMNETSPDWEMAVILSKVNQFYFTGTMQDGILLIPRHGEALYWVRRSYERALDESSFAMIMPMNSFSDVAKSLKNYPDKMHMETEVVPLAMCQRMQRYFNFNEIRSLDAQVSAVRSVKSPYELSLLERAGAIHQRVLEEYVPDMLREGMSEAELALNIFSLMVREGHHGVARFAMFDTEIVLGYVCFGESSVYPTYFNGPGGNYGLSPAVPLLGSHHRKLKKGDLVFIDIACGVDGYHTDKTMTYVFGGNLGQDTVNAHNQCVEIQNNIASMLKPGNIPSNIYKTIIDGLTPGFINNFMGFGSRRVKFLGHGIGLQVDETPVIAEGFDEPIREGMVFALEPKKGFEGTGMVGIENTFVVTPGGGRCITGDSSGLIPV